MALKLLQAGKDPLGQFDGLDSEYLGLLGGEIGTFTNLPLPTTDRAAYDVVDGYANAPNSRICITRTLVSGDRPLFLLDEGTLGYGTMFGYAIGGVTGHIVPNPSTPGTTGGVVIGPSTAWGSGKVTCWDKPGLYAVTLDAVAADLVPTLGIAPGAPLYATAAGLLTSVVGGAFENFVVARFVEFSTNGSLVTTPTNLVGLARTYTQVVIHFHPGV